MARKNIKLLSRRSFIFRLTRSIIILLVILSFPVKRVRAMAPKTGNKPGSPETTPAQRRKKAAPRVAIEPCTAYNPDRVHRALLNAIGNIGFVAPRGASVLLKPNIIGQNTPEQAVTTHPSVVEAVCRYFTDHSCRISIGDSSAFYQGGCTALGFETTGIAAIARKYGAKLVPFETTRLSKITSGHYLNPFYVTGAVFEHDLLVNLPKLKVHRLARYSGAIKNMYGCVVGGSKQYYHKLFQSRPDYQEYWGKPLVDVFEAVEPHLTVMDAVIGLDKDGPAANGEPRFTGLLLASESAPALDVIACRIIGIYTDRVPAVREAMARNLVSADAIAVHGHLPSIPYTVLPDLVPKQGLSRRIDDYVFDQFIVTPVIDRKACTRCDACVEGCATGAIRYDNAGLPVIDYGKCIHCYCCESYCGQKAIRLSGSALNMLMRAARQVLKL
jgi:uncharacterized protein (DUF362 family)/ferredoxin